MNMILSRRAGYITAESQSQEGKFIRLQISVGDTHGLDWDEMDKTGSNES